MRLIKIKDKNIIIKFVGESPKFSQRIGEKCYVAKRIFNCDDTGFGSLDFAGHRQRRLWIGNECLLGLLY